MNKIISGAPKDHINDRDDMRYVIINQIRFDEFIEEFSLMSKNKEPYKSFITEFCEKIEEIYDLDISDINATYDLQKQFASELMKKYRENRELISDFPDIFNFTTTNLSISWAVKTLYIKEPFRIKRSGRTWNM